MKVLAKILIGVSAVILLVRLAQILVDRLYDYTDRKYILTQEEDPLYL